MPINSITTEQEFDSLLLQDGERGTAVNLNRLPLQLKTEIDILNSEISSNFTSVESNLRIIEEHEELLRILKGINPLTWSQAKIPYNEGDYVFYNSVVWRSNLNNNENTPSISNTSWELIKLQTGGSTDIGSQQVFRSDILIEEATSTISLNQSIEFESVIIYVEGILINEDDYSIDRDTNIFTFIYDLEIGTTVSVIYNSIPPLTIYQVNRPFEVKATAGQTVFEVNFLPGYEHVFVEGIKLSLDEYTTDDTGSSITLNEPLEENTTVMVQSFGESANFEDFYTKSEIDNLVDDIVANSNILNSYATIATVNSLIQNYTTTAGLDTIIRSYNFLDTTALNTELGEFLTQEDLVSYYNITQVNNLISTSISGFVSTSFLSSALTSYQQKGTSATLSTITDPLVLNGTTLELRRGDGTTIGVPLDGLSSGGYTIGTGLTESLGTLSHTDTSTVSNTNNSGTTVIQNLTFDEFGHVQGFTTANVSTDGSSYTVGTGLSMSGTQIFVDSLYQSYINNGNTAYNWGNHATSGYLTSLPYHSHNEYASTSHSHSEYATYSHTHNYASTSHTHSEYAPYSHSHTGYATTSHTHTGVYAPYSHSHTEYAYTSHTHSEYLKLSSVSNVSSGSTALDYNGSGHTFFAKNYYSGGTGGHALEGHATGNGNTGNFGLVGRTTNSAGFGVWCTSNLRAQNAHVDGTIYNFTGSHKCFTNDNTDNYIAGDIICTTKTAYTDITNSYFEVLRSSNASDKRVLGVFNDEIIQTAEDIYNLSSEYKEEERTLIKQLILDNDYSIISVNSIGEGAINVCEENGDIENGDYIVTSSVPGKGMKQEDDLLRSSTVAKATEDVIWANEIPGTNGCFEINGIKCKMIGCTYHCG